MKKILALAALPLLALTGCSGGGSSIKTVTVTTTASAPESTPGTTGSTIDGLRVKLNDAGIPCLHAADWTPATNGEYDGADAAGMCGQNKAIIATHESDDGSGPLFLALNSKALDIAAGGGTATTIVTAEKYSILTDPATAQKLKDEEPSLELFN